MARDATAMPRLPSIVTTTSRDEDCGASGEMWQRAESAAAVAICMYGTARKAVANAIGIPAVLALVSARCASSQLGEAGMIARQTVL